MPTHVSFECLRDKRANWFLADLAIPDVSGICPAMVKLLFSGWFVGSSDISREFRWSGVLAMVWVPTSRTLTNLESSLWWSYRTSPVWTTRGQRLVFKCLESQEFRWSEVPAWVASFDTSHTLTQLHGFQIYWESGVPTVGSFGIHQEFRRLTLSL